jgi:hypothetical protein
MQALRSAIGGDSNKPPSASVRFRRRQVMLDQDVQGRLLGRLLWYWLAIVLAVGVGNWCWSLIVDSVPRSLESSFRQILPGVIGSMFIIPLLMANLLRLSNRFVAPVIRLRNALKCLELGDRPAPLALRQHDFWWDVTARFNQLLTRLAVRRCLEADAWNEDPMANSPLDPVIESDHDRSSLEVHDVTV